MLATGNAPLVSTGRVVTFSGACDASGAVTEGRNEFVVADDEDNVLRTYLVDGGAPVSAKDVSTELALPPGKKRFPEADIEAATKLGAISFWLTSHGRTSKGKEAPSRQLFFATRTSSRGAPTLVGKPYTRLVEDLLALPSLRAMNIAEASAIPPKAPGGLNIEGMTAAEDGTSLLIGFRSPVPGGKAIVLLLRNPIAVLDGTPPVFDEPIALDLGGRGIRSISWWRGNYLLVGGSTAEGGTSRLFRWSGRRGDAPVLENVDLADFNPEAFATFEDRDEFLLFSDDGSRMLDGVECKKVREPSKKKFRGIWVGITKVAGELPPQPALR